MNESSLPPGWMNVSLGELLEFKYGKSLPNRVRSGDGFPVYGSNGIVGYHDQPVTDSETIIIGRKGSVGEINYSTGACFPIDTTYYIDEFYGMPPRYWVYVLKHLELKDLDRATAIPSLNREDAYALRLQLAPLNEQHRIADKLDILTAKINECRARLDRIPQILQRFRQSVLESAASGEITKDWRGKSHFDDWEFLRADDVCEKVQSGGTPKEGFIESAGIPFLKVYTVGSCN